MADNRAQVDPRFLTYNKDEVQTLLDKIDAQQVSTEADVRAIVTDYTPDNEGE